MDRNSDVGGKLPEVLAAEKSWEDEWAASAEIQAEFCDNKDAFMALMRAEARQGTSNHRGRVEAGR